MNEEVKAAKVDMAALSLQSAKASVHSQGEKLVRLRAERGRTEWEPLPESTVTGEARKCREAAYERAIELWSVVEVAYERDCEAFVAFMAARPGQLGAAAMTFDRARYGMRSARDAYLAIPGWIRSLGPVSSLEAVNTPEAAWDVWPNLVCRGRELAPSWGGAAKIADVVRLVSWSVGPALFAPFSGAAKLWNYNGDEKVHHEHWKWLAEKGI